MENEAAEQPVIIHIESNPNPNSMKFVSNFMLLEEGKNTDFPDQQSAANCPLAWDLFKYNFVERVFISSNFVTVTKTESSDWNDIIPILKPFIQAYLEDERPLFLEEVKGSQINDDDSDTVKQIKQILDEYVRPAVESDGGMISFHSFEDGIVKVQLQGSCSGCPSSTATLKQGIENLLQNMVPGVKEVEAEGI